MVLSELVGYELGNRTISYVERDAILYALTVGASRFETDLVYERDLRVLPTYACALGLWAVEAAGELGAYDRKLSLHASQSLDIFMPLPKSGNFETSGKINGVWDKGKAALLDIEVECKYFRTSYGIFLPGLGGWGGERAGSSRASSASVSTVEETGKSWSGNYATSPEQAALYRLTGDLHPIHIDPSVAKANRFERPILHGLCTLGIVARMISEADEAHPSELTKLNARLSSPVLPGDVIEVTANTTSIGLNFEAVVGSTPVLKGGRAAFC
jgi:acyl dehydratase